MKHNINAHMSIFSYNIRLYDLVFMLKIIISNVHFYLLAYVINI